MATSPPSRLRRPPRRRRLPDAARRREVSAVPSEPKRWAGHRRDSPRGFWRFCRVGISEPVPLPARTVECPPVPLSLPFPFRRPIRCPFGQQKRQCFDFARDSKRDLVVPAKSGVTTYTQRDKGYHSNDTLLTLAAL